MSVIISNWNGDGLNMLVMNFNNIPYTRVYTQRNFQKNPTFQSWKFTRHMQRAILCNELFIMTIHICFSISKQFLLSILHARACLQRLFVQNRIMHIVRNFRMMAFTTVWKEMITWRCKEGRWSRKFHAIWINIKFHILKACTLCDS